MATLSLLKANNSFKTFAALWFLAFAWAVSMRKQEGNSSDVTKLMWRQLKRYGANETGLYFRKNLFCDNSVSFLINFLQN